MDYSKQTHVSFSMPEMLVYEIVKLTMESIEEKLEYLIRDAQVDYKTKKISPNGVEWLIDEIKALLSLLDYVLKAEYFQELYWQDWTFTKDSGEMEQYELLPGEPDSEKDFFARYGIIRDAVRFLAKDWRIRTFADEFPELKRFCEKYNLVHGEEVLEEQDMYY